ncbi:hypothetical protein KPG66_15365 [Mycetohabitans sp. B2]|jgi:hypothetical protein|uniref:hypothetical protein n=1 Tax=Mycetohabitans sp. B2 TaxID=2841274 RepID=UPI001F205901|nr:hypothetical protein [Mycetohabitans sp. B2]MCF7697364.1 hypothetical protein [Mycetohabitans sp. B2]
MERKSNEAPAKPGDARSPQQGGAPRQRLDVPTAADRRLTEAQKATITGHPPAPTKAGHEPLPAPQDVGEDG